MSVPTAILAPELRSRISAVQICDPTPAWSRLGPHRIRYAALAYFERGITVVGLNGVEHRFAPGDVAFVPCGSVADTDRAFEHGRSTWWSLAFDGISGGSTLGAPTERLLGRLAGVVPVDPRGGIGRIAVPTRDRSTWIGRLYRIREELALESGDADEMVLALLTTLAVDAARLAGTSPRIDDGSALLTQLVRFVTANINLSIGLRDVARALAFSPSYLTEVLRRETGRSVCEWVLEVRVRRAEEMLLDESVAIAEIASAVGYDDARSFRRAFARARSISPQAWRMGRCAVRGLRPQRPRVTIIRDGDGFRTSA